MGRMLRPYRPYDEIVEGDVIDLGGVPRKVLSVSRDELDRVRWINVSRLKCGYAKLEDGSTRAFCTGPVPLYHCDLAIAGSQYEFRGWYKRVEAPR